MFQQLLLSRSAELHEKMIRYLHTLLLHGARAVLRVAERKETFAGCWGGNSNVAAVAQANKTARIVWALLVYDREYDAHYSAAT